MPSPLNFIKMCQVKFCLYIFELVWVAALFIMLLRKNLEGEGGGEYATAPDVFSWLVNYFVKSL